MNPLRCAIFLHLATTLALGQAVRNPPETLVRSLYIQVLAHHATGLLTNTQISTVTPYLSKSLLHKIADARACSADWDRHNPDPHLKARLASTFYLFTGEYRPAGFHVDSTEQARDGSLRVYVTLTQHDEQPKQYTWSWRVAPILLRDNGRLVVDDILYVDDSSYDDEAERRHPLLSQYLAAGCNGPRWIGPTLPHQPDAFVTSLYQQVLARYPGGIPTGADWKVFAPYMSRALMHKIDLALACEADWDRKYSHSKPILKPPFGTLEMGIFSGGDEETAPRTSHIDRTERRTNGSIRVHVTLGLPQYKLTWPVAVVLQQEDHGLVIDDVIFLKDEATNVQSDYRLSQALSSGCRGPRWIGPP